MPMAFYPRDKFLVGSTSEGGDSSAGRAAQGVRRPVARFGLRTFPRSQRLLPLLQIAQTLLGWSLASRGPDERRRADTRTRKKVIGDAPSGSRPRAADSWSVSGYEPFTTRSRIQAIE